MSPDLITTGGPHPSIDQQCSTQLIIVYCTVCIDQHVTLIPEKYFNIFRSWGRRFRVVVWHSVTLRIPGVLFVVTGGHKISLQWRPFCNDSVALQRHARMCHFHALKMLLFIAGPIVYW